MYYTSFNSSLGELVLISKGNKLVGLYISSELYNIDSLEKRYKEKFVNEDNLKIFIKTKDWLKRYFNGEIVYAKELDIE